MAHDEPAPSPGEPQRSIALVDDDRNILTTLSIALQAEGYATRVYSDGEAALKALIEHPPDLAVFDIKMPRMDGMELLVRLRERGMTWREIGERLTCHPVYAARLYREVTQCPVV